MAKSLVRAPSSRKGRKVRALDELASEYQRGKFLQELEKAPVYNIGYAASKAHISLATAKRLIAEDKTFAARVKEIYDIHEEAWKFRVGEKGVGTEGKSGDPTMLKLHGQMTYPETMRDVKDRVEHSYAEEDIDSMNAEELQLFIAKRKNAKR